MSESTTSWRTRMSPRSTDEDHRVSTPLELLFDLTFVVAISQVAVALAHDVAEDHVRHGLTASAMVFFAVWWAWMNFTWFASSYDVDDVPYRVLTMVQMAGVLVLAAGVPTAFEDGHYAAVTLGYLIMRVPLILQWLRAAAGDPERRATCLRYAVGIGVVQLGWLARLALPEDLQTVAFLVLVVAELAVPTIAERTGGTPWHPHHIAERYGLFTIIVLGESVLGATRALEAATDEGVTVTLVATGLAGLVLLFGLWWLYFLEPAAEGLASRREVSFVWGYGHYGVFGAMAGLGAGLEVAAEAVTHHLEASDTVVTYSVAVPVAVFAVLLWLLHVPLQGSTVVPPAVLIGGAVLALLFPLAVDALHVQGVLVALALTVAVMVAITVARADRRAAVAV